MHILQRTATKGTTTHCYQGHIAGVRQGFREPCSLSQPTLRSNLNSV
jgi:hypothetical protein